MGWTTAVSVELSSFVVFFQWPLVFVFLSPFVVQKTVEYFPNPSNHSNDVQI